jgi:hypothetical protein
VSVPDFHLLAQLAECLSGSGLHADWTLLCKNKNSTEYQAELHHCIHQLMEAGRYQQGLDFVMLVGLPKETVVIAQVSITYALCFHVVEGIGFVKFEVFTAVTMKNGHGVTTQKTPFFMVL